MNYSVNRPVPWLNMTYSEAKAAGLLEKVEEHCQTLGNREHDYRLYLKNMCEWPK